MKMHTESDKGDGYNCGVSAMQGRRDGMEDAHIINEEVGHGAYVFAVFDGHGGSAAAEFAGAHFASTLREQPAWISFGTSLAPNDATEALRETFFKLDEMMRLEKDDNGDMEMVSCGCTAVVVLLTPSHIVCANAGDSRCIMQADELYALSDDHKPGKDVEFNRIQAGGGFVLMGRVNGILAVSRSLGDFYFKVNPDLEPPGQLVTAEPDITVRCRGATDRFVVLACDGVWDVMDNKTCAATVVKELGMCETVGEVCESIIQTCFDRGSNDNMSLMVIELVGESQGRRPTEASIGYC